MGSPHNLLVISDVHLGEDLRPGGDAVEHVERAERGLVEFLRYHTLSRLDDKPWKLVVNGDLVDLLSVCLLPADAELLLGLHPDDHTFGVGARAATSLAKMRRVLDRHAVVFRAMARFLGVGNEVAIVIGNHDAEFHWPEVQETIRDALVKAWAVDAGRAEPGARTPEEVGSALSFHPWFFFEEGTAWIEHGHQYDPYCSFDAILDPVDPADEGEMDLNVSAAALRYVRNLFPMQSSSDDVGFWQYLAATGGQGASGAWGLVSAFGSMNLRLLRMWWARTPEVIARTRQRHLEKLRSLAARTRLSEDVLLALDDLRERPSTREIRKLLGAVMLDRLVTTIIGSSMLLVSLVALPWAYVPLAVAAIMASMMGLHRRFAGERASIYPQAQMRAVARQIRRIVRAPIVVFGHAHEAAEEALDDGGRYFNTGTWVAERHEMVRRTFTHLRIRMTPEGPRAELCQWRKGRSLAFQVAPVRTT